jgi:2-polyprenyl-3-methyl-5-hydroxy-6-metoxy-1,4-benzoquinol methylase
MDTRDSQLSEPDRAEMNAARRRPGRLFLREVDRSQIDRYLNPPGDSLLHWNTRFTCFDVRGKTVLDFSCGTGENAVPLVKRRARVMALWPGSA